MPILVETKSGKGKIIGELNNKIQVLLLDEKFQPIVEDGKEKKILCSKVEPIGFID